jgi:hypothetical protein
MVSSNFAFSVQDSGIIFNESTKIKTKIKKALKKTFNDMVFLKGKESKKIILGYQLKI